MANLKEIRNRISSVQSTMQITSAMKMVSAAKFKKANDSIIRLRPYAKKLNQIYKFISDSLEATDIANIYASEKEVKSILIVLITSNKGLCGAFNQNVIKEAINLATKTYQELDEIGQVEFFAIGKKGYDFLIKKGYSVMGYNHDLLEHLNFDNSIEVINKILDSFIDNRYNKIDLVYNKFKNAASQIVTSQQYLPVVFNDEESEESDSKKHFIHNYIFEPSKEYIVNEIVLKSLKIQFYKALLDSYTSEHGARMTAMHKATENAEEMIDDLQLHYNKARQTSITKEILEIVGGAEALNK